MSENTVVNECRVEVERCFGLGSVQIVHQSWAVPIDLRTAGERHHLELALTPRGDRCLGCFPDHWGPRRFEPIGELFLVPAQHIVWAQSDCHDRTSIVCSYEPQAVTQWLDADLQWTASRLRGTLSVRNPVVRDLMYRIGAELHDPGFASDTLLELMAGQAIVEVVRHLIGMNDKAAYGGLASRHLRLIDERLADVSVPPPKLSELAALCRLSVRHLTRGFRISRGMSIGDYIADHRVTHARRLLASGMSVKAVAYITGFAAPSNFTTAFLRATGETPSQFKRRSP